MNQSTIEKVRPELIRTRTADDEVRDRVRVVEGVQPYVHNYYTYSRFFEASREKGEIRNRYGQRVLHVPEEFVIGMSGALEDEVGEKSASEIMYRCGQSWGREDMRDFVPRVQREFECEFSALSMGMMLETWWWPFNIQGWGTWRYDFSSGKQGLIFVDLFDSAVAKSLGNVGNVVCHYYAGLFSSSFSGLAKRALSCIEVQCYGTGEDYCRFLIASDKRVKAADFWRNEGASGKEIIKKIKDA